MITRFQRDPVILVEFQRHVAVRSVKSKVTDWEKSPRSTPESPQAACQSQTRPFLGALLRRQKLRQHDPPLGALEL